MSDHDHALWYEIDLICRPLKSLAEIHTFMSSPPSWRTLCRPLQPHSKYLLRNSDAVDLEALSLESPASFCHEEPGGKEHTDRYLESTLPKTLVCHDMANGYHDDSDINGTGRYDSYTFYNWAGIDIFCYFSHHMITIPPLGWINVAHDHGVKVIGTFITEWATGMYFWEQVLGSQDDTDFLVNALVTIAKTLKFEGWLLNFENKMMQPEKLKSFVKLLHHTLHQEVPNAILIWYDSVIEDGTLSWQNKLNDKNKVFFDMCDGFFTNYSWREADVRESAAAAGARLTDVYIGIDVWGRNVFGGGMFNTQEAVKVAHASGCSLAIFAPAWTHEGMAEPGARADPAAIALGAELDRDQCFLLRDRALWGSLWPFLNTRVPCQLPFKTSFCRGRGLKRRMYGEVICNAPWFNLRHQQYQPNSALGHHGYLLSTNAKLKKAHHLSIKNHRGIMRIRQSLMDLDKYEEGAVAAAECEVRAVALDAAEPAPPPAPPGDTPPRDTPPPDTPPRDTPPRDTPPDDTPAPPPGLRAGKKVKRWFRRLLKRKKVAFADDKVDIVEIVEETVPSVASSESLRRGSQPSMQLVPVCLRLSVAEEPTRLTLAALPDESECLQPHYADAYSGGACLRVHPSDPASPGPRTIRLLYCDFPVEDTLICCLVTKSVRGHEEQYLTLRLAVCDAGAVEGEAGNGWGWRGGGRSRVRTLREVVLEARARELPPAAPQPPPAAPQPPPADPAQPPPSAGPHYPLSGAPLAALKTHLVLHEPGFYMPTENVYGWNVFYYSVRLGRVRVRALSLRAALPAGPALLGHLGLCERR